MKSAGESGNGFNILFQSIKYNKLNNLFIYVKEKENLQAIYEKIKLENKISSDVAAFLFKKYGDRFIRALELVNSKRVLKYVFLPSGIVRWIVIGRQDKYLVFPRIFCQCNDFYLSVVIRRKIDACYHLLAQAISEAVGNYEEKLFDDKDYIRVMQEFYELRE